MDLFMDGRLTSKASEQQTVRQKGSSNTTAGERNGPSPEHQVLVPTLPELFLNAVHCHNNCNTEQQA